MELSNLDEIEVFSFLPGCSRWVGWLLCSVNMLINSCTFTNFGTCEMDFESWEIVSSRYNWWFFGLKQVHHASRPRFAQPTPKKYASRVLFDTTSMGYSKDESRKKRNCLVEDRDRPRLRVSYGSPLYTKSPVIPVSVHQGWASPKHTQRSRCSSCVRSVPV